MASSSPMLRALGSAWRSAREVLRQKSHSSTRVRHETGSHLIRIDNYSRVAGPTSAAALPGHRIQSAPFFVGDHEWQLHFYPNGAEGKASSSGRSSVKLIFWGGGPWWLPIYWSYHATAAYEVSILDGEGNRVLGRAFRPRRFSALCDQDAEVVATAAEMRAAATRGGKEEDGGIVVRCDVTMMILDKD